MSLKELAVSKISMGNSRQEVFEELKTIGGAPAKEIADLMRGIPPKATVAKIRPLVYCMCGLLLSIAFIRIGRTMVFHFSWITISMIVSLVNLMLAIWVLSIGALAFKLTLGVSLFSLLNGFPGVFLFPLDYSNVVLFIATLASIFLSYYILRRLSPKLKRKRELYNNELGQQRGRDVIYFED